MLLIKLITALLACLGVSVPSTVPSPAALMVAAPDTTKPVIVANTAIVSGQASIMVTITDNEPLSSAKNKAIWVEIYGRYDQSHKTGQKVDLSSGSGVFTFDSTKLPDGEYILRVGNVIDAAGNSSGVRTFKYVVISNSLVLIEEIPAAAAAVVPEVEPEPSDNPTAPADEGDVDETETEDASASTEETPSTEEVAED